MRRENVRVWISKERYRDGHRYRVTTKAGGTRAAKTFASESDAVAYAEIVRETAQQGHELTVGDLYEQWIDDARRRVKDVTLDQYKKLPAQLCDLDAYVVDVDRDLARQWYRAYQEGRKPATHHQALQLTRQMWGWGVDEGLVADNPWKRVKKEGKASRRKPQLRIDEARKLSATCYAEDSPAATAVLCGLLLGLRPAEMRRIAARDIDDDGRVLWIDEAKTEEGDRHLELPPELGSRLLVHAARGELVPRGKKWIAYHVRRLCVAAGVEPIPPHGLRGTHASLATDEGATSRIVAAALGQRGTAVAESHYIDPAAHENARVRRALRVLSGGKS